VSNLSYIELEVIKQDDSCYNLLSVGHSISTGGKNSLYVLGMYDHSFAFPTLCTIIDWESAITECTSLFYELTEIMSESVVNLWIFNKYCGQMNYPQNRSVCNMMQCNQLYCFLLNDTHDSTVWFMLCRHNNFSHLNFSYKFQIYVCCCYS